MYSWRTHLFFPFITPASVQEPIGGRSSAIFSKHPSKIERSVTSLYTPVAQSERNQEVEEPTTVKHDIFFFLNLVLFGGGRRGRLPTIPYALTFSLILSAS